MKRQSIWVSALFSVSMVCILCLFIVIALQINAINKLDKQNKLLESMADTQNTLVEDHIIIKGMIPLHDEDDEISNDSTISVEQIDSFVEDNDIVVEEKIVIHTENKVSEKIVGQDMDLPDMPTDRKVCTNFTVYGIAGTPHNRMQLASYTDEQGCRRYNDYYVVGLGSAYADRIGETFEVELDTGVTFKIITGDMKADCDTDITNRYCPCMNYDGEECANILEFIVDRDVLDPKAYAWGGVDYYQNFKGNIVRLTYLGRDNSADWDSYY